MDPVWSEVSRQFGGWEADHRYTNTGVDGGPHLEYLLEVHRCFLQPSFRNLVKKTLVRGLCGVLGLLVAQDPIDGNFRSHISHFF